MFVGVGARRIRDLFQEAPNGHATGELQSWGKAAEMDGKWMEHAVFNGFEWDSDVFFMSF